MFSLGVCALCLEACSMRVCMLGRVRLFASPWTVARQAPLSMEFSRQEYWSGFLFSISRDLPDTGMETESPSLAVGFFTTESPGKPLGSLPKNPCMAGDLRVFGWPTNLSSFLITLTHITFSKIALNYLVLLSVHLFITCMKFKFHWNKNLIATLFLGV